MGLTKTAIARPVFMLMLMLVALLLGNKSRTSMRVEQNPDVSFGVITVTTPYPGAGPEEINTLISRKIEEVCAGVNGIREVTSSSQEGVSSVVANFEIGTDMDNALNETRAKVDAIVNQLPKDVQKPTISKIDTSSTPVLYLVAKSETLSNQQLRDLADDKLKDRFARVAGVASVSVTGGEVRELQVQVSKDKLLSYGVGIAAIQRAIQGATLNIPSGKVISGDREYSVRVLGEFKTPADLENMVISVSDPNNPQAKGRVVRLKDIATIQDSVAERTSYSRLDGRDAVVIVVQKAREGNAIEISKAVKDPKTGVLAGIKRDYNVSFETTLDQATTIEESINDLNFSLFLGIALVALIVFIFLHDWRGTLIVAIAIPVCIFATFIVMNLLGFTINNLSMLALSLAIGALVDDAIVVIENIYRHLRLGEDPKEAAINGRNEIGLAAIAITLADFVVFTPIGFMGGVVGQFFRQLGIGFAVTIMLSLFVSFTITPMLASRWYRAGEDLEHWDSGFAGWFERVFGKFTRVYRRMLEWCLNHRWFVFITGNVVLIAVFMLIGGSFMPNKQAAIQMGVPLMMIGGIVGFVVFVGNLFRRYFRPQFIAYGLAFGLMFPVAAFLGNQWAGWKKEAVFKFGFMPPSDNGSVAISIELPPGASLEATERVVKRVEDVVSKHPDTKYVLSQIGSAGGGGFGGSSVGSQIASVTVTLNDKSAPMDALSKHEGKRRNRSDSDIAAEMLEQVGRIPGANVKVSTNQSNGFGSPIQMAFKGDNREELVDVVNNIKNRLASGAIPGVINADISSKPGKPEFRAIPDRIRLADSGLSVSDVANTMRILYQGNNDTKFRSGGKEYDIRVMMDLKDRNNPDIVNQVPVTFNQGNPVYLGAVSNLVPGVGVDKIDRRDRTEEVRLTADLLPGYDAGGTQQKIDKWLVDEKLVPADVTIKPLGQADVQQREMGYLFGALLLGLLLVYMVLASLYENLLYPLIIQLAQPQAMVGALLALMITDKVLNIVGFIGIIALVGLVAKNAILVVDYTNTLRQRGQNRHDALVEAAPTRLRPIMMTTLALIFGMLPVALAIGRGSEFRETIGITIIGGITLSTLLTLLVIPCSYTIFDDASVAFGNLLRRIRGEAPVVGDPYLVGTYHSNGVSDADVPEKTLH